MLLNLHQEFDLFLHFAAIPAPHSTSDMYSEIEIDFQLSNIVR